MQLQVMIGLVTSFNVSKEVVFKRALSGITPFNVIVELGSSNIIQQGHVRSKLKGNVIFNARDVKYRGNSSEFTVHCFHLTMNRLTHDAKIVYCCDSFNKSCIMKAKDTIY